jgi:hypothetical protein
MRLEKHRPTSPSSQAYIPPRLCKPVSYKTFILRLLLAPQRLRSCNNHLMVRVSHHDPLLAS